MKCRYCGNELRSGERFCRKCGKPAEAESVQPPRFCIECGAELLPNAGFCRSCGAPVSQQKPEQPQQPNATQTDEKAELKRRTEILVIAAQGGDSESFAKLYELYHQKVFALAKTTVKSDADAEDVLQMTFIKAWDHLDRLKDTSAFSTWIQRITLNQCYSLLRKQHATIPIDNDDEDSEPIQIESDLMLPEVYAEQNDLKKRLGKIIDELSDVQKQTITLYYFDGLPVENIAWIMDCSVNTVKSRLFLARKSIKTEIEEQERKSGQPFYGIVGLATIPFGQFFVAHVKASSLSQTAASALLKAIAGKIAQSASAAAKAGSSAAAKAGSSAAVKAGTSAAAKGAAKAGAKTAAAAGTKAAAGAGAKTAAAVGASVSKKVIAGIVAGTLAVGTVAGGTVATVKIVQNNRERKAAERATTVVTDGTFPSVTASDPFLPQDPSGGLSAQEPEAYQAYLDYLIAHKEGIDNYLWQIGGWEYYYEIEEGTDRFVPLDEPMTEDARLETRSVVFYDISGDALPELIYVGDVASPAKYTSVCTLNVLTYRDDQLVSLFSGEWYQPKWEDFTEAESLYVRPDGTLVSYYSESATFDSLDYYEVFAAGENGTLHREFALKHVYDSFEYDEGDGSPIVEEWYGPNKERITKEEYEAQLKGVMPKDCILLFDRYSYASFAMTADEAIAWLQSQLGMTAEAPATPAPTAEPTPSDVGATSKPQNAAPDTVRNAYQAYIEVLEKNRKFIQLYEEYPDVFDNTLDKTPDHTQRAVAFHDLNNDGIPELIYIRDQGSDENDIELNVLSFQHEEIITVYTNNVLAGDAGNYFYFTLKDDPTIYVNFKDDAEYTDLTGTYSDLYSNEYYIMDNSWKDAEEKPFLSDSEEYVASKGGFAHVYRENDKEIDRAAFEAKERALLDRMDCCLILGWMASQTMECNAMTCDEAIAWLKNRLAETAAPTAKPADEVSTENPDHTADDASRVRLTDLKSISTTPRETTAKLTDNYETVYEYAVINNHGYNGSAGPLCYEFLTNAKYRLFTGTIYVPNGETSDGFSSLTVKGDGFTLYTSPAMSKTSKPVPFEVNVAGFNDIVIEWSNNSGYSNISNLNCCIGDAYFIVDPDGSEQPDRLHLPISLTDLNSIYSAVRRNTRLMDNFGNTYNKAIYNRIDNLHGNTIPVLEYLLNAQYSRFCCTLYIPEGSSFRSAVVMHVLADDVEIYVSPEMTATSGPVEVDIDLSGCANLKITFSAGSWYNSGSDATLCLADPYLYLAGDR